ncbi:MAG: PEP-CTERM sorting domain-containing protein [Gammaproteobacteria bacterium]|nr:PEP-CTERM sorting domain-containing protein [Gammaproteobacteria bacterium]
MKIRTLLAAGVVAAWSLTASAGQVWDVDVLNDGPNPYNVPGAGFSLIHATTGTSGATLYNFVGSPTFSLDLDLANAQEFATGDTIKNTATLPELDLTNGTTTGTFKITALDFQIQNSASAPAAAWSAYNNAFTGDDFWFIDGSMSYEVTGFGAADFSGTFAFGAMDMNVFNRAAFNSTDGSWAAWLWGADQANGIGIDFAIAGLQAGGGGTNAVPAPTSIALMMLGLAGLAARRRR